MWGWRKRRKQLSCQEVVALVTEYLEDALPARVRQRFEEHLQECLACPEYVEQIRAIAVAAARPSPEAPPVPSAADLVELFRALKRD